MQPLRNMPDYGEKTFLDGGGGTVKPQDFTDDELLELAVELTRTAKAVLAVNPYLNTPPTELRRDLETEKNAAKRKQMKEALNAWRLTVPGPFRRG